MGKEGEKGGGGFQEIRPGAAFETGDFAEKNVGRLP